LWCLHVRWEFSLQHTFSSTITRTRPLAQSTNITFGFPIAALLTLYWAGKLVLRAFSLRKLDCGRDHVNVFRSSGSATMNGNSTYYVLPTTPSQPILQWFRWSNGDGDCLWASGFLVRPPVYRKAAERESGVSGTRHLGSSGFSPGCWPYSCCATNRITYPIRLTCLNYRRWVKRQFSRISLE